MPDGCSDYHEQIKVCLCRADNCLHVTLKQTRSKDILLILLDLLLETYKNCIDELVDHKNLEKPLSDREKVELLKKDYKKYIDTYELMRKMKNSKVEKVEEEYKRHVKLIFDSGLSFDIDQGKEYLKEAREFAELVLKTIGNAKE